jgi:hypothetical protein
MTFQQQTKVVEEEVMKQLSSSNGFLIGYSIDEHPIMFKSPNLVIKFINGLSFDEKIRLHNEEVIIYKNKISPKNTVYGEDDYDGIYGEILETEEYLQFDKKSKVWK